MLSALKNWRRKRILARHPIDEASWRGVIAELSVLHGLEAGEMARLRELVVLFIDEKTFTAAGDLVLSETICLSIAAQACLPILNLGLEYYSGWSEIIVYPDEFVRPFEERDEAGVVHVSRHPLAGESWLRGPLILSWRNVQQHEESRGVNVVIHEFAHKLDMLNGAANGYPPLHRDMSRDQWAKVFADAYQDFCRRVDRHYTVIDPYAAESPAEFFAVLSEVFFQRPMHLKRCYPEVYEQLTAFYRQDPMLRLHDAYA